jgi:8-oxo-dGTP diphosphatase
MPGKNIIRPTIGVGVLVWREKQLLLGKRLADKQDICWQFPGGHLENNESVIECAIREVQEETSLKVKSLRHLGFTDNTFAIGQRPYITLLVSCDYQSGVAQTLEPYKCEQWRWFDYPTLPAPLFKPIRLFMSQCDDLYAQHCASYLLADSKHK